MVWGYIVERQDEGDNTTHVGLLITVPKAETENIQAGMEFMIDFQPMPAAIMALPETPPDAPPPVDIPDNEFWGPPPEPHEQRAGPFYESLPNFNPADYPNFNPADYPNLK